MVRSFTLIDAFCHFLPRPVLDRFRHLAPANPALSAFEKLPTLWDMRARLDLMNEFEGYRQVICLSNPPIELLGSPRQTPEIARFANDHLAEVCAAHPRSFPGFVASLPLNNPDACVIEATRACDELGAVGVQIFTNAAGRPMSDPVFLPLFDEMASRDLPVLIHPMRSATFSDYQTETQSEDEIWFTFGWPYETSACVTRLIYSGLFDRLPGLKIVTHHMGGMIPYFGEKIALGFSQIFNGTPTHNPQADRAGLKREPIDYYHMLYADTAVNGSIAAARCGHAFFGADRCLFATDAPFDAAAGRQLISRSIAAVEALDISAADKHRIFETNALDLFGLGLPA